MTKIIIDYNDDKNQYTKEISRNEFESKYNPHQDEYNPNTSYGRRLRSQERNQGKDP